MPKRRFLYNWHTDMELRHGVQCVIEGDSFHMASKKSGVGANTIKKYYIMYVKDPEIMERFSKKDKTPELENDVNVTVFTKAQEAALIKCLKDFNHLFYGLTGKECRMIAYQMVINEDIKIPVGWKHGMASVAWLASFRLRNSHFMLNLKKPDRICLRPKIHRFRKAIQQDSKWEKKTVVTFYDDLEKCIQKYPELKDNKRIYSLDEAYTSTDYDKRTAERESRNDLFTTCCFVCADGSSLPPVVVKPFLSIDLCSDFSPGGVALTGSRGQLTPDLFTEVMQHFINHSKSSMSNPSILIIDTDLCHLSYAAINLAKESGVEIVTMHPHVATLLQPLQGKIFETFYKLYYDALEAWWLQQKISKIACKTSDIGQFIGDAYSKVMTPENILNGFKKCGISPFDRDLFTDSDYLSCVNQMDHTCIECRIRDDRSRNLDSDNSADKVDDTGEGEPSGESQVETMDKPSDDEGATSQKESKDEDQNLQNDSSKMNPSRTQTVQELDKLKRRLIRSVARLIKEKKTEEEVWDEMKKECGENCKKLWMRMRSLTMKKLKRLIDADDRNDNVPAVARMNLTDWLLYDLVLVHEKVDVINRSNTGDNKVLNNLFSLVQRFQIEGRVGDDLAEAWIAATVSYNSKGHQCSPMLMQRRWYQVKELARHKLYQFWFNYRGNERLLITAKQDPPTALQRAIALRYPEIITKEFPSWEERIESKLVIMPEEFETKMNKKHLVIPSDEAVPDIEIIEKKIDTITVESDSDFDDDVAGKESTLTNPEIVRNDGTLQTPIIVQVKTEPDDPYGDIDITEHPVCPIEPKDRFQDAIDRLTIEENRVAISHMVEDGAPQENYGMPFITNVVGASDETITSSISIINHGIEIESNEIDHAQKKQIVNSAINKELENVMKSFDDNSQESIVIDDDEDDVISSFPESDQIANTIINIASPTKQIELKEFEIDNDRMITKEQNVYSGATNIVESANNNMICPVITSILSGSPVTAKMEIDTNFENSKNGDEGTSDAVHDTEELLEDIIHIDPVKEHLDSNSPVMESNVTDDVIEFADDGIEYEENNDQREMSSTTEQIDPSDENAGTPKFDLKLLMQPVVYTTKLDDMKVWEGRSLCSTIDEKPLVDKIFLESKPVSAKSVNVEQIQAENDEETNNIQIKVENSEEFDDDLFQNELSKEFSDDELEIIPDSKRVKPSSLLLQKPRSRTYNPIQLCKNPDFNTRLKRLPLGFFSSERNRVFLKACKPMTIDLSKTFETKLINGTMYLKPSDSKITPDVQKVDVSQSAASITPSAVAVQSLMDTTDVDKILQDELKKRMLERNKIISLPNISLVRHINQNLLMAEVAPIITQVQKSTPEIKTVHENNTIDRINNIYTQSSETAYEAPRKAVRQTMDVNDITNQLYTVNHTTPLIKKSSANFVKQTIPVNSDKSNKEIVTDSLLPMMNNDKSKEDKTIEKQKKKYSKLNVHKPLWSSKYMNYETKPNESLLTIDTLYRVLNALDPTSVDYKKPKTKSKKTLAIASLGRPLSSASSKKPCDENQLINNKDLSNQIKNNIVNENLIGQSLTTLSSDPSTTLSSDSTTTLATSQMISISSTKIIQEIEKIKASKPKKQRNCCWAKTRINKLNGHSDIRQSKHKCPEEQCRCCCREILRQIEINLEIQLLENMQNRDQFDETIEEVVQNSRNSPNVQCVTKCVCIDTVTAQVTQKQQEYSVSNVDTSSSQHVRHSSLNEDTAPPAPQPVHKNVALQVETENDSETLKVLENAESYAVIDNEILGNESEVIDLVDDDDNLSASEMQTPKPKIRVYSGGPSLTPRPLKDLAYRKKNRNFAQNYSTLSPLEPAGSQPTNSTLPLLVPITTPLPEVSPKGTKVVEKVGTAKIPATTSRFSSVNDTVNGLPCSCRPNVVVDKLSSMLVVDGSNECPQHTKSRVSKETRIYLNRRHMSAASRPFYVGKNKILLTNITPRKVQVSPPPLPPLLELPAGVQIVLLPDGTVSYLIDPGVELTPDQKLAMPTVLASVLEQIKATGITLPVDDFSEKGQSTDSTGSENSNVNHQNRESNNTSEEVPFVRSMSELNAIVQAELQKEVNEESSNTVNSSSAKQKVMQKETDQESFISNDICKSVNIEDSKNLNNTSGREKRRTSIDMAIDTNNTHMDVLKSVNFMCSEITSNTFRSPIEQGTTEAQEKNIRKQVIETNNMREITKNDENGNTAKKDDSITTENHKTDNIAVKDERDDIAQNEIMDNGAENKTRNTTNKTNNTPASSSRNLLSDLMEMSGILEEDINPIQPQPVNGAPGSIQPLTVDIVPNSLIQHDLVSSSPASPLPEKHLISARINETTYNLNPITSFDELKYACDNNGLFFKLDLNNGLIVPINVCIQKNTDSSKRNAKPSEVIDLTDEQNFTIEEPPTSADIQSTSATEVDPQPEPPTKVNKKNKSKIKLHIIKPKDISMMLENPRGRKLPKYNTHLRENNSEIVEETTLPLQEIPSPLATSMAEKKIALMKRLSNNLRPLKFHHDKRSPIILRKPSLINTNTPIVQKLSNLNKKFDNEIYTDTEYILDSSDDSEDDEPLAKIARKMRPDEASESVSLQESQTVFQSDGTQDDNIDFEKAIDAVSAVGPPTILNSLLQDSPIVDPEPLSSNVSMAEPVPTQLVVSGAALEQPLPVMNDPLSFVVANESDQDSDEDCILGV